MTTRIRHLFMALIIFTCIPILTHAAEYTVDGNNFQTSFQSYLTLAAGTPADDTIILPAGSYTITSTLFYDVPNLGAPGSLAIQGPSPTNQTVLSGDGTCTLLNLNYWYTSGIFNDAGTTLTIRNVSFQYGHYPVSGYQTYTGGLYIDVDSSNVLIEDCSFLNNRSLAGGAGGLYVVTYDYENPGWVSMNGCTFTNNWAYGYYESAGGATISASGPVTVTDCEFGNNLLYETDSDDDGAGGLYLSSDDGAVVISGNTFTGNEVQVNYDDCAGGAYIDARGAVTFENNTFSNNSADESGGTYIETSGPVTVSGNTFTDNAATDAYPGGLNVSASEEPVFLSGNTFSGNTAVSQGGGAEIYSFGSVTIVNNMFQNNSAIDPNDPLEYRNGIGGALYLSVLAERTITNNTFIGNSANYGGGIYARGVDSANHILNVYNNIFWDNESTGTRVPTAADLHVALNDFDPQPQPLTINLFNNDYADAYIPDSEFLTLNEADNINEDPQLDMTARLTSLSPCIEVGLNSAPGLAEILYDIDGDPRIADNGGEPGATIDMGADEYVGVLVYYTLSASVSGGNGTISPPGGTYAEDSVVTLTATPDDGYRVASWNGTNDDTSTALTNTVTMDNNKTVTVTFELIPVTYTLTVDIPGGNGSVSLSPPSRPYLENTLVTLTATPASGYQLASWSGTADDTSLDLINTVTMDDNKTVTVTFELIPVTYTLTVDIPGGNGSVSLSPPSGPYLENTLVTLTATPASGYHLASWSGTADDTSLQLTNTVTMDSNKTVSVYFTEITYSLTVTSTGTGILSVDPDLDEYAPDTTVTIGATPADGWLFDHWDGDVANPDSASTTVTMDSDKVVNAVFTQIFYTLTMAVDGNGTVTPSTGDHSYASGDVVNISASAQSGWLFDHWDGDVAEPASNSTTVAIDADKTVTAVFTQITYSLTTNVVGQGTIALSPSQPSGGYAEGFTVQLGAIPADGWQFAGWSVDLSGIANPVQLTMDSNKSVTATFTEVPPDQYALTVYTNGSGTVTLNPATGPYDEDTLVTLTAAPSSGNQLASWFGTNDDAATTLTNTVTMNGPRSVTVTFELIPVPEYTLNVSVSSGQGSVSPASGTYEEDTVVPITATPEAGWQFDGWGGDLSGSTNPETITMDSNKSVTAIFTEILPVQYTLTINTSGSGTVTLDPATGPYDDGTGVSLTAIAAEDYMFDGWSGDVADSDAAETTVTMDADKTVTAEFVEDTDSDGVPSEEEQGPDGTDGDYDGNGDGDADAAQANVVSAHTADAAYYITLASPDGTNIVDADVEDLPENAPANYDFPYGLISFAISNVTDGSTTMEIYLPEGQTCDTYYKYNETSDTWEEFLYDEATGTGAVIEDNKITLHFVDGMHGDQDNIVDGIITDPGTPGISTSEDMPDSSEDDEWYACFISTAGNHPGMNPLFALFMLILPAALLPVLKSSKTR